MIQRRWDEFELQRINDGRSLHRDCGEEERCVLWEGRGEEETLEETAKSTRGVDFIIGFCVGTQRSQNQISTGKQMLCTKWSLPYVKILSTLTISLTAGVVVTEQSTFVP